MINRYLRSVFEVEIEPKRVNGRSITAPELLSFFEAYCHMFQSGNGAFPKAMTMLEATAEANNRNAYDISLRDYKEKMTSKAGPECAFIKDSELLDFHGETLTKALEIFDEIAKMGSLRKISSMRENLQKDIDVERVRYFEANALKVKRNKIVCYFIRNDMEVFIN